MDKIRRIFPLLMLFVTLSCTKTVEIRIPYRQVNLELDLRYNDKSLNELYSHKIYNQNNISTESSRGKTGFGGVIVFHGSNDIFYAFDAACPYEALSNVILDIDEGSIFAICPKCGSKYELIYGVGNSVEGPSTYSLQRYTVDKSGQEIHVYN